MSTPMEEVPEHVMIPVDINDEGPAEPENTVRWLCWCNTDCGTVQHIYSTDGNRSQMCLDLADTDIIPVKYEDEQMAGGRCPVCAGYALRLQQMRAEGQA